MNLRPWVAAFVSGGVTVGSIVVMNECAKHNLPNKRKNEHNRIQSTLGHNAQHMDLRP